MFQVFKAEVRTNLLRLREDHFEKLKLRLTYAISALRNPGVH